MTQRPDTAELRRKALPFVGVAFGMLGMAYAAVPLYDWFCRVTGFGGTTQIGVQAEQVLDRTITVRFDASLSKGMPWEFKPVTDKMDIRVGETGLAFYEATNPTDSPVSGAASYNVSPFSMGGYFVKIDCFCFQNQTIQPGETVRMPVTFFVDPEMVDDNETRRVHTVTLSYTFYETEPENRAALE